MDDPNQMAERPLPIRAMWCFYRGFLGRTHHQPSRLPLDYHLGPGSYECHHFHFLLCEWPRLASVLLLSLSPDYIYLGRLTGRPYCWTSVGRRSLGTLHCKLPRLRQRDCSSRPSRCLHSYSANELVYRFNHCRRRHLWLQSARRSVVLANPSCLAVDLPRESLLSGLVPMRADSSRPPSWSSSSSPPNLLGGLFVTDAKRKPFALSSASVRNLERTLNRHWP